MKLLFLFQICTKGTDFRLMFVYDEYNYKRRNIGSQKKYLQYINLLYDLNYVLDNLL